MMNLMMGGMEEEHHSDFTLEMVADKVLASPFHCLHFSVWNRYVSTVSGGLSDLIAARNLKCGNAPNNIHPHYLTREDVSCTNHTQTLPYPSRDILEHEQLYGNILQAFGELFE